MPRISYSNINFKPATLTRIGQANDIIAEYAAAGFDLTLRQLYYQFVSRNIIANNEREYDKLGSIINDGRLAGLIDWEVITDRTRFLRQLPSWDSPSSIVAACAAQFRLDKWARQDYYIEAMIEKDALVGVLEGVCTELEVPYLACRGYASASEVWRAGHQRLRQKHRDGKQCTVIYLGDHDPSGIDMTRDLRNRLCMFAGTGDIEVVRLALNMDQVEEYAPPPNPTKLSDSRAKGYIEEFGMECWELDALTPTVITALVRAAILERRNEDLWQEAVEEENEHKKHLDVVANHWTAAVAAAEEEEADE